jgi:hypothetical protein
MGRQNSVFGFGGDDRTAAQESKLLYRCDIIPHLAKF